MSARRVVTEADVRAAEPGKPLMLAKGVIVTPSARDAAEELGITIETAREETAREETARDTTARTVVALGADHGGFPMKEALKPLLKELGRDVVDVGTASTEAVDYPDFATAVAILVSQGKAQLGIMVDGAGIGSCMVANKVPGVRAALCYDLTTAKNAREHNDANVLTLGGTLIGQRLAGDIVRAFLETPFAGGRHQARVDKINRLDA